MIKTTVVTESVADSEEASRTAVRNLRNRMIFLSVFMALSAISCVLAPSALGKSMQAVLFFGQTLGMLHLRQLHRRAKETTTVMQIVRTTVISGVASKILFLAAFLGLAILTALAVSLALMTALIGRDVPAAIGLILVLSNIGVWWLTLRCWTRVFGAIARGRRAITVGAATNASCDLGNQATAAPIDQTESPHWWTDTTSREEIRQINRR